MTGKIITLKHSIYLRDVCDMEQNNVHFFSCLIVDGTNSLVVVNADAFIDIIVRISFVSLVQLGYL